jgi:hypothetical protein
VDHQRRVEVVANGYDDRGAFGNADQGRRHSERAADFAKRLNLQRRTLRSFRMPASGGRPKRHGQRAAIQAAGGPPIVIGLDLGTYCARGYRVDTSADQDEKDTARHQASSTGNHFTQRRRQRSASRQ